MPAVRISTRLGTFPFLGTDLLSSDYPGALFVRGRPGLFQSFFGASACQTREKALSLRDCPNVVFASARAIALDLRGLGGSPANHARHFSSAVSSALVRTPDGGRSPPAAVSFLPCAAYRCSSHQSRSAVARVTCVIRPSSPPSRTRAPVSGSIWLPRQS